MNFELLLQKLKYANEALYAATAKSTNIALTLRNWMYGYYIVEFEQNGEDRAKYGAKLIRSIEKRLKDSGIKGLSFTNLNMYRQFYFAYPQIVQTLSELFKKLPIIQAPSEKSPVHSKKSIIPTRFELLQALVLNILNYVPNNKYIESNLWRNINNNKKACFVGRL